MQILKTQKCSMWKIRWKFDQKEFCWQKEVDYFTASMALFMSKSVDDSFKVNVGDYEKLLKANREGE